MQVAKTAPGQEYTSNGFSEKIGLGTKYILGSSWGGRERD